MSCAKRSEQTCCNSSHVYRKCTVKEDHSVNLGLTCKNQDLAIFSHGRNSNAILKHGNVRDVCLRAHAVLWLFSYASSLINKLPLEWCLFRKRAFALCISYDRSVALRLEILVRLQIKTHLYKSIFSLVIFS